MFTCSINRIAEHLLTLSLMTLVTGNLTTNKTVLDLSTTKELTDYQAVEEFCNGENFQPKCTRTGNDVIVVLGARYGRMRFGRCLEEEPGFASLMDNPRFIGCSADVKSIIEQRCSGQSECSVRINDQNFDGVKPCYANLKLYLDASYICVQVAAESRHCTVPLTTEPQHIVGGGRSRQVQTDTVGCGTKSQPWSIEALSGQRIAVSLIDFGKRVESSNLNTSCSPNYGVVIDKQARKNVSLCRQNERRVDETKKETIHVSQSNHLQIVVRESVENKILIQVEAVGCSDLASPSDSAWLKRVDDQITVGCYLSRQSWQLNCVNGVWTGTVGVCSEVNEYGYEESRPVDNKTMERHSLTEMAGLVAVLSCGVTICFLVICVGLMCLRSARRVGPNDKVNAAVNESEEQLEGNRTRKTLSTLMAAAISKQGQS